MDKSNPNAIPAGAGDATYVQIPTLLPALGPAAPEKLLEGPAGSRIGDWAQRFIAAAKERDWKAEMAWFNAVNEQPDQRGGGRRSKVDATYLRNMAQSAIDPSQRERWGGYPEVYALSRLLRRRIVIVSSQFTNGWTDVVEQQDDRFTPNKAPLFIYFAGGNHYEALRLKGG